MFGLLLLLALAGCKGMTRQSAPPMVTISAAGDVTEGSPLKFLIRAEPAPSADLTVGVRIESDGGCELRQAPESVTIVARESRATLTVPTSGAGAGAEGCMVTATVVAGSGYAVGSPASATVAVTDDDTPEVTVAATASTVSEGSAVSFMLTAEPAPAAPLTVKVSWSESGTFLAGSPGETVTIPTSGSVELEADTDDDSGDEPDGSVTVTVVAGSGYAVGSPASATVAVTDDDMPEVTVAATASTVSEGSAVSFMLTAEPAPAAPLTVKVSWSESGTFLAGSPGETVTIPTSGSVELEADTKDDSGDEADGSVTVTVVTGNGYAVGSPASATVAVTDDDTPEVTITATASTVSEGSGVSFMLTAEPAPAASLTVKVSWSESGTFLAGSPGETVTIPTSGSVELEADTEDDSADEADGSVTVRVVAGSGYAVGSPASATVAVTDDDTPEVTITATASTVSEGSGVSFMLTAEPAPAAPLTVKVSWSESGTFLAGSPGETATIPTSGSVELEADTEDDSADEADGSVTVRVLAGSGYVVGSPASATVAVTDDDTPEVTITATASTVSEGSAVSFMLTAEPAPAAPLTVKVSWSESGTFLAGSRGETVMIPTSGSVELEADTEDDSADEADGSVTVTVVTGNGYAVGSPSSATVAVTDDDPATTGGAPTQPVVRGPKSTVTVTAAASTVTEGETMVFTFTASPPPASTLTVFLNWSFAWVALSEKPHRVEISTSGEASVSVRTFRVPATLGFATISIGDWYTYTTATRISPPCGSPISR